MSAPRSRTRLPHVSVVVPAKDCAALLPQCLAAVDAQTYRGPLDITVALAPSRDGTERVLSTATLDRPLQVIDNPSGTTSAGLNAAVAACAGEVVARVDAQSRIPPEYIERSLATLAATSAANVGGIQHPVGATGLERAIAAALASPFGGGPARFRGSQRDGPADTVYLGVFDRAALDSVGGFDETLERNQDYDLNWRFTPERSRRVARHRARRGLRAPKRLRGAGPPVLRLRPLEARRAAAPSAIAAPASAGRPGSGWD